MIELEPQLARLVAGIAETDPSQFMVAGIALRERELAAINQELSRSEETSVDPQMKDLRKFVETRLGDIRRLMGANVQRAREELSKHVSAIRSVPTGEGKETCYLAEGNGI